MTILSQQTSHDNRGKNDWIQQIKHQTTTSTMQQEKDMRKGNLASWDPITGTNYLTSSRKQKT